MGAMRLSCTHATAHRRCSTSVPENSRHSANRLRPWDGKPRLWTWPQKEHDLTNSQVVKRLCHDIRTGKYTLVFMALPCQTF